MLENRFGFPSYKSGPVGVLMNKFNLITTLYINCYHPVEDSAADEAEPLESVPMEDEVDGNMPAANRDVS